MSRDGRQKSGKSTMNVNTEVEAIGEDSGLRRHNTCCSELQIVLTSNSTSYSCG
jgi:hypothetical protein